MSRVSRRRTSPGRELEADLRSDGYLRVAGVDEVGRGAWAGPVVAAAVIIPHCFPEDTGICDSKMLTPRRREELDVLIRGEALAIGIGVVSQRIIDRIGIVPATRLAMARAISRLRIRPQALLIDAVRLADFDLPQRSIIHGDSLCLNISAASIVAKVHRDRLMARMDYVFSGYGFSHNKGYGTPEHAAALQERGPCRIHRGSFAPVRRLLEGEPASSVLSDAISAWMK